jgi:hypothetical protein
MDGRIHSSLLPEGVKNYLKSPPPSPSPVEGEGIFKNYFNMVTLPLAGEGRVRGNISIFSQLPCAGGRMAPI